MEIHKNIIRLRKQKGISQKELARLIQIDDSTMSKIESGTRPIRHFELNEIANVLNVTTDELLGRSSHSETEVLILRFDKELNDYTKKKIIHFIEKGTKF